MRRIQNWSTSIVLLAFACSVAGCGWSPVEPYSGQAPRLETLYVIASGWHTEIGVRAVALSGPLASTQYVPPHAQYLVFGWGERDYYMARNPGFGDLLNAAMPSSSIMLIIPLGRPPTEFFTGGSRVLAVPVSSDGLERLSTFLWDYIEKDEQGVPHRVGDGPYAESSFYASHGTYSLGNTCNTWTAEALRAAGLPVSGSGVVFAHQVIDQVLQIAPRNAR